MANMNAQNNAAQNSYQNIYGQLAAQQGAQQAPNQVGSEAKPARLVIAVVHNGYLLTCGEDQFVAESVESLKNLVVAALVRMKVVIP